MSYKTHSLPQQAPESNIPTDLAKQISVPFSSTALASTKKGVKPNAQLTDGSSHAQTNKMVTTQTEEHNSASHSVSFGGAIPRRTLLVGAATLAAIGVGGFAWSRLAGPPTKSKGAASTPTTGTTFLVYKGHAGGVWAIGWSPNGDRIASGSDDQTVQIWDSTTGTRLLTYEGHVPLPTSKTIGHPGSFVETLAWSPDGQWIASGGKEASLHVWNTATGNRLYTYKHKDLIATVAWSKDGKWLASGGWEGTIHICDALTGKLRIILKGHTHNLSSIDWSQDGSMLISGNVDNTVRVWDTKNGNTLYIYRGHSSAVKRAAWSPDGKLIASGGDDKHVHIWDFVNKNTILIYDKHTNPVKSIAWSPDGKFIASAGDDHTVQIWNTSDGTLLYTYRGHLQTLSVKSAIWSLDGKRIASASYDQTVHIWQAL